MELSGTNQPVRPQIGFSRGWGLGTNLLTPTSPDDWHSPGSSYDRLFCMAALYGSSALFFGLGASGISIKWFE
ncbi:hypothetical protein N7465_000539 [Penicillium sp. CMV-2018d]|nr:hypothetical protein N7465_000539 [Penicillium sp. CMV-2018d]